MTLGNNGNKLVDFVEIYLSKQNFFYYKNYISKIDFKEFKSRFKFIKFHEIYKLLFFTAINKFNFYRYIVYLKHKKKIF